MTSDSEKLWATKSEDIGLIIVRAIGLRDFQPAGPHVIYQRHRQTDRQTTCNRNTTLCTIVHRTVKMILASCDSTSIWLRLDYDEKYKYTRRKMNMFRL